MAQRHFLYLANSRMVSMTTRGKRIEMRREFAVSGAGVAEFERYLGGIEDIPAHIFTDLAEEDFRLDTIPHVGGRDRDAVMGRKVAQMFRSTPFRYAAAQGREAEGRRDDRVVYTAVTNPEVLRPWVDALEKRQVPLAGIRSIAVFSAVLLEELDLAYPHTLLVTFTPGEAMRQTYFRNREIRFSRLTPVDLQPGQSLGAMIAEETTRTWQYLDSLRFFQPEDRLEVCVMVHPHDRAAVQAELRDFAQIQYHLLDIEIVATKLGLRPPPLGSSAEEVYVHLFQIRPVANHFASPEMRRFDTLRRARQALTRASLVVVAAGLAWGGYNVLGAARSNQDDVILQQQLNALNGEYDEITRVTPSFGVGGSTMRDTVAFYNAAMKSYPSMPEFLESVSQVLGRHDPVRVLQVAWVATDNDKAMPALASIGGRAAAPVHAVARGNEPGNVVPAGTDDSNPPFAGGRFEVAMLEGSVRAAPNDYRGAVAEVQKLADDIGNLPGYRADVVESPLDVRPSLALQGRHTGRDQDPLEARFVLRVVHERRPAA